MVPRSLIATVELNVPPGGIPRSTADLTESADECASSPATVEEAHRNYGASMSWYGGTVTVRAPGVPPRITSRSDTLLSRLDS
jgi:hypothetical protein